MSGNKKIKYFLPWMAISLFAVFVLSHDLNSKIYIRAIAGIEHSHVETMLNWGFIAIGVLTVLFVVRRESSRLQSVLMETLFIGFVLAALDHWLIFTYLERIHFVQYALMGFLVRLMTNHDFPALLLLNAAGIIDELIQYAWNPQYTKYLDFNDMLLNFAGGMIGLLLVHALLPKNNAPASRERNILFAGVGIHLLLALALCAGLLAGKVAFYDVGLDINSVWHMVGGKKCFMIALEPQGGTAFSSATHKYCRILSLGQWGLFTFCIWSIYILLLRHKQDHFQ